MDGRKGKSKNISNIYIRGFGWGRRSPSAPGSRCKTAIKGNILAVDYYQPVKLLASAEPLHVRLSEYRLGWFISISAGAAGSRTIRQEILEGNKISRHNLVS